MSESLFEDIGLFIERAIQTVSTFYVYFMIHRFNQYGLSTSLLVQFHAWI